MLTLSSMGDPGALAAIGIQLTVSTFFAAVSFDDRAIRMNPTVAIVILAEIFVTMSSLNAYIYNSLSQLQDVSGEMATTGRSQQLSNQKKQRSDKKRI